MRFRESFDLPWLGPLRRTRNGIAPPSTHRPRAPARHRFGTSFREMGSDPVSACDPAFGEMGSDRSDPISVFDARWRAAASAPRLGKWGRTPFPPSVWGNGVGPVGPHFRLRRARRAAASAPRFGKWGRTPFPPATRRLVPRFRFRLRSVSGNGVGPPFPSCDPAYGAFQEMGSDPVSVL